MYDTVSKVISRHYLDDKNLARWAGATQKAPKFFNKMRPPKGKIGLVLE